MAELGYIIQVMFEMQASHLFCFRDNFGERFRQFMRERYSEEELQKFSEKNDSMMNTENWQLQDGTFRKWIINKIFGESKKA